MLYPKLCRENYLTFEKLVGKIDERSNGRKTSQTLVANELEVREIKIGFGQNHSICKQKYRLVYAVMSYN